MRSVGLGLLVLSILLGGIAIWGFRSLSGAQAAPAPGSVTPRTVIAVAARPIAVGETLDTLDLKLQAWPADAMPPGAFHTVAEAVRGAPVALTPIAANEPILKNRISGPGARASLSGAIQPGMRAAAIRVDDVNGVGGFVLPGDFVDVLVTRPETSDGTALRTDLLLEGVRVLAVDQVSNPNKNDPVVAKAATVELTPAQAQKLALARQAGVLSLWLRGTADPTRPAGARSVRTADLGGAVAAAPASAPSARVVRVSQAQRPPAGPAVTIYRAGAAERVAVRSE
jgi:pilus assembly protein CpaB